MPVTTTEIATYNVECGSFEEPNNLAATCWLRDATGKPSPSGDSILMRAKPHPTSSARTWVSELECVRCGISVYC
jgi:hypothetical protein